MGLIYSALTICEENGNHVTGVPQNCIHLDEERGLPTR